MIYAILSHRSALAFWSSSYTSIAVRALDSDTCASILATSRRALHRQQVEVLATHPLFSLLPHPIELLVCDRDDRRTTKHVRLRCTQASLPDRSFIELAGTDIDYFGETLSIAAVSPELLYVQMAPSLSQAELIELGYELCGKYAIAPDAKGGFVKHPPVTTPERLQSFAARAYNMYGSKEARKAAGYVLANSWSPKETQSAMLACAPKAIGGLGLDAPLLNHTITLPDHITRIVGYGSITPDQYWPEKNKALEYESYSWHDSREQMERDARRRNALNMLGIELITMTYEQMSDLSVFDSILNNALAGSKRRVAPPDYDKRRRNLHSFLLRGKRIERFTDPAYYAAPEQAQ